MNKINLKNIKKAHIVGIEGAGTSAIAQIYNNLGIEISGSDNGDHFYRDVLNAKNIKIFDKFDARNLPDDVDLVIYSTAFSKNNPELEKAKAKNIPILSYPEALGKLFEGKFGIAVSGTHGKTTTTAMLAECLRVCGTDPSAIVGGKVSQWKNNILLGKGNFFVAEADEYQNKLQYYHPLAAILTNADWDHPDFFPTVGEYMKVFADFVAKIPKYGFLVYCGDDADAEKISASASCEKLSYGFGKSNDVKISDFHPERSGQDPKFQTFDIAYFDKNLGTFEIQLIGKHNALNAAAAIAVCRKLKFDLEKAKEALKNFQGTVRRFEYVGEKNGAILVDDYAHHPAEIKATLRAAREKYPQKNITVVFHPHTFTRTKTLLSDFSQSFDDANSVIVIDIYGSAREKQGGVSSKELVDLINGYNHGKAEYVPAIKEVISLLGDKIGENDVVISMGAGDVWRVTNALKR